MPKKDNPGVLSPDKAAILLGITPETLRYCLQIGYYGDIGHASKTRPDAECYVYEISKYKLFEYLGYDVTVPTDEAIKMVQNGCPPWIKQNKKDVPTYHSATSR